MFTSTVTFSNFWQRISIRLLSSCQRGCQLRGSQVHIFSWKTAVNYYFRTFLFILSLLSRWFSWTNRSPTWNLKVYWDPCCWKKNDFKGFFGFLFPICYCQIVFFIEEYFLGFNMDCPGHLNDHHWLLFFRFAEKGENKGDLLSGDDAQVKSFFLLLLYHHDI